MGTVDGVTEDGTKVLGFGFILQSATDETQKLHYSTSDVKELVEIHGIIGTAIAELVLPKTTEH